MDAMTRAVVLAGGAARGAYGAGVARYIYTELPRHLGWTPWPDLVSGTSVGALNGVFVSSHDTAAVEYISNLWCNLSIEQVYNLRAFRAMGSLLWALRSSEVFSLLDASPLMELVKEAFPEAALRAAIDSGKCRGFFISATDLATGFNTLFVDSKDDNLAQGHPANVRTERVQVAPHHCLASAALPLLFAPVEVGGRYYVDGGLRQNTPLRPVIQGGAQHVLVISGRRRPTEIEVADRPVTIPNLMYLAGKSLNSLLLDPGERDLKTVDKVNRLLDLGQEICGADFIHRANVQMDVRRVETLFLRPSDDLGLLAREIYRETPPKVPALLRRMLNMAANPGASVEADLLSYLFFDKAYTAELESRGFEDTRRQEENLAAFFERSRSSSDVDL